MITKNISGNKMNTGIYEQNKLIDTLKRIVSGYGSVAPDPLEKVVKKYLSFTFLPVKKVSSNENIIFFVPEKGKNILQYSVDRKIFLIPGKNFLEIKDMFDLDEDSLEEIIKIWASENLDVEIDFINYYY
jgi:hypothetical protein